MVHEEIGRAFTPDKRVYLDAALYERSKEDVFASSWQFVGDTDDLKVPGVVKPFTLLEGCLDEPMMFTRGMDDELSLLSNICTHRGNLVAETGGVERFLRCRYHGRRFGLDGKFQFMPEFEGVEGFPSPCDDLPRVPFGSWSKLLFASVAPRYSLEDLIGPMKE
ncbi:MAG TPA: Rieske (2Fe-2S) protein, partial [Fimbriimonadaceae bacterium]|nr:Rieske (2Fe-2S) protein [Fimbriimonadaceae bacterium]